MFGAARKRRNSGLVGVAFAREGFAVVALADGGRDAHPRLTAASQFVASDPEVLASQLAEWVDHNQLKGAPAKALLAPGEYHLLQIEAPPVAATEMRQAAAWRVRELIDFPIDQAVIDTFEPPEATQRGTKRINVVVAHRAVVAERIQQIEDGGLTLDAIDIADLGQAQVSRRLPDDGGHALLALDETEGLITVYRDGELYLARSLDRGRAALANDDGSLAEALLLEVQRSFDYFESSLSQPPLGMLYLYPADDAGKAFAVTAANNLSNADGRTIQLADLLAVEAEPEHGDAVLLRAVGAALRDLEVA